MRVVISHGPKNVIVEVEGVVDAGWLGFNFAKHHSALVAAGWLLLYFTRPSNVLDRPGVINVLGVEDLADKIREGPPCDHSCPQHPEVTG